MTNKEKQSYRQTMGTLWAKEKAEFFGAQGRDELKRECPHCHGNLERYEDPRAVEIIGNLEKEIADNERWMRAVLTDFRIPFDDHTFGRRFAFAQWMAEHQLIINRIPKQK